MIKVNGISKNYRDVQALHHFSCEFQNGITALLGPNGAGKSTLMSLLACQIQPDEGFITINDENIFQCDAYLQDLSYMPQMQNLIPNFTGIEFLYYVGYLKNVDIQQIEACIKRYQKELELTDCLNRMIHTYSGGMKQRLLFLSCLLSKPKILLLDEPTAGLDPMQRNVFKNLIVELSKDTTIILATHIVQDVEDIADHVVMMNDGQVINEFHYDLNTKNDFGNCYEIDVKKSELEKLKHMVQITQIQNRKDNYHVRFISDQEIEGCKKSECSLEDYYISIMKKNHRS